MAVPNADLTREAVPGRGDSWEAVSAFCLSYDGHAYWDDLPELANRVLQRWTRDRSLPEVLDELRGCLFSEQRRWHHFGAEPSGRSSEYVWALLDAVRAVAAPAPSTSPGPDPRTRRAPEAHVKLVPAPAPEPVPEEGAVPARRLAPVAAADAHIRLVSSIEAHARRLPALTGARVGTLAGGTRSMGALRAAATRHPSAQGAAHPSGGGPARGSITEFKPMPSAEPLPKPPVIGPRPRPAGSAPTGAVIASLRPPDGHGIARRGGDDAPRPSPTAVPVVFRADDAGYTAWMDAHRRGFVLNVARAAGSAPVLHVVGCAALPRNPANGHKLTVSAPKVCATSVALLATWSTAQGMGRPIPCRRCQG